MFGYFSNLLESAVRRAKNRFTKTGWILREGFCRFLLLTGENGWPQVLFAGVVTLAMVVTIAMLNERFLFAPLNKVGFVVGVLAVICLLLPFDASRLAGLAIVIALVVWNARSRKAG